MSIRGQLFPARKVWEPRYVYYDRVVEPDTGVVLDEGCVVYFEAPQSYTGEDVLELQLHASPQVMQSVLSVLLVALVSTVTTWVAWPAVALFTRLPALSTMVACRV